MSLVIAVSVYEGIVLTADSRVTYKKGEITVKQEDNEMKIYWLKEQNIGIMHCGNERMFANKGSSYMNIALMWFKIKKINDDDTVSSVANKLYSYIKEIGHQGTHFWVAGFENDTPKIFKVDDQGLIWTNRDNVQGFWMDGIANISNTLDDFGDDMDLQDAKDFSEFYFNDILSKKNDSSISEEIREVLESCGGKMDMLVLRNGDSYWEKNKNLV